MRKGSMANNRMYLVCNVCERFTAIAKTMGDGWYATGADLNDFFNVHEHVSKIEDGLGSKQFTFVTEVDDPKVKLYDFARRKIKLIKNGKTT